MNCTVSHRNYEIFGKIENYFNRKNENHFNEEGKINRKNENHFNEEGKIN